jgi:hypothetical protein
MLTDFQRDLAAAGFVGLFRHTAQSCCLLGNQQRFKNDVE